MKEFYYPSQGAGQIHACRWEPEGEVRAVLQIVHGVTEHIGRYDDFARFLNRHGILVVGEDHMGHGKSVEAGGMFGYFTGGWSAAVADTYALLQRTKQELPKVPYVLLGYSMGSFMTRTILFRYPNSGLRGAILVGTGQKSPAILRIGKAYTDWLCRREGETAVNPTVQKLMFGPYNKHFPDAENAHSWLNSDASVVADYLSDPLCGFGLTNGLARDMLTGYSIIQNRRNLDRMMKTLPVLFLSGDRDPVGDMGKGVLAARNAFEKAGMCNTQLKLYPGCRHEVLKETCYRTAYDDVLRWIQAL